MIFFSNNNYILKGDSIAVLRARPYQFRRNSNGKFICLVYKRNYKNRLYEKSSILVVAEPLIAWLRPTETRHYVLQLCTITNWLPNQVIMEPI